MSQTLIRVEPSLDGLAEELVASQPETLPFAPSQEIRAFHLKRAAGDLLIYCTSRLTSPAARPESPARITRQYLNHRHEAIFSSGQLDVPLFVHANEGRAVSKTLHVRATFSRRHLLGDDFEVIPTPGHTSGATAYLWDSGRHRFLFTGDTILLNRDEWRAAVLDSSDRESYLESLELIRGLEFDVLVPWAASRGWPHLAFTDRADTERRIDAIIERVRAGESG